MLCVPPEHRRFYVAGAGEVDLADPMHKIAIEVQGCFYHGCARCGHSEPYNDGQAERDAGKATKLRAMGWELVVVWEHEFPVKRDREQLRRMVLPSAA